MMMMMMMTTTTTMMTTTTTMMMMMMMTMTMTTTTTTTTTSLKVNIYCCGNLKFRFRPGGRQEMSGKYETVILEFSHSFL